LKPASPSVERGKPDWISDHSFGGLADRLLIADPWLRKATWISHEASQFDS